MEKKEKISLLDRESCAKIAIYDHTIVEFITCMEKTFFPDGLEESHYFTLQFIKYMGNLMINLNLIRKERQKILVKEIENNPVIIETNRKKSIFAFYSTLISSFLGIVGIVAAKVCEDYYKPSLVGIILNDKIKGSIRSIEGVNVGHMMMECKKHQLIIDGGGHSKAGGFTVKLEKWESFVDFCDKFAENNLKDLSSQKKISVDYILSANALNRNLMEDIACLRPFGEGNPNLNFLFVSCKVIGVTVINSAHLILKIELDQIKWDMYKKTISAWCFFYLRSEKLINLLPILQKNTQTYLDILAKVGDENTLHIVDFRFASVI